MVATNDAPVHQVANEVFEDLAVGVPRQNLCVVGSEKS
jgi:hypothetical protein